MEPQRELLAITIADAPNPDITSGFEIIKSGGTGAITAYQQFSVANLLPVGYEYTMSCYARVTDGSTGVKLHLQYVSLGDSLLVLTTEWKKYSFTFTSVAQSTVANAHFGISTASPNSTIQVCGMKLELGNKATDWSPSPWDITNVSTLTSLTAGASNVTVQYVSIFKQGNIVVGSIRFNISTAPTANGYVTIATLPEGYRPSIRVFATFTSNVAYSQTALIEPTGEISFYATTAIPTSAYIVLNINFGTF